MSPTTSGNPRRDVRAPEFYYRDVSWPAGQAFRIQAPREPEPFPIYRDERIARRIVA